jgi:hypothetical protein
MTRVLMLLTGRPRRKAAAADVAVDSFEHDEAGGRADAAWDPTAAERARRHHYPLGVTG